MVTPYTASAASVVVRGLCVMTMNCVRLLNWFSMAEHHDGARTVERTGNAATGGFPQRFEFSHCLVGQGFPS